MTTSFRLRMLPEHCRAGSEARRRPGRPTRVTLADVKAAVESIALALLLMSVNAFGAEPSILISHIELDTNGLVTLKLTGPAPRVYRVFSSEDLSRWQPIGTNLLVDQTLMFADPGFRLRPRRFYRVELLDDPPYVPGEILLRFKLEANAAAVEGAQEMVQMNVVEEILSPAMEAVGSSAILCARTALPVPEAVAMLKAHPAVEFAEPNYLVTHTATANDPYFGGLWGMQGDTTTPANEFGSQAAEAWDQGYTGSRQVYVGIIDTGVYFEHEDLAPNMWRNPFEIPANGIDDDQNGYVDDLRGWDFLHDDNTVYDPSGSKAVDYLGTHMAGIIGAVGGNGVGVAGVNWRVTMIPGKILGERGEGSILHAIRAIDYFVDLKLRHNLNIVALNNSWSGGGYSQALHEAILRAAKANILFIASAGNSGSDNDQRPVYPANYDTTTGTRVESPADYDAVVSVAAIQQYGELARKVAPHEEDWSSNVGVRTVDLGAPGDRVWSTVNFAPCSPCGSYLDFPNSALAPRLSLPATVGGTSVAAAHVTGAAALYASTHPSASAGEIRAALLNATLPTPALQGKCVTGGRLNLKWVIEPAPPPLDPPLTAPSDLTATLDAHRQVIELRWRDNSTDETAFRVERGSNESQFAPLATLPAGAMSFSDDSFVWGLRYDYRVRALRGNGVSPPSNVATVTKRRAPWIWYVEKNFQGPAGLTFATVTSAHNSSDVLPGDTLRIRADNYPERLLLTKQLKLEVWDGVGVVRIGQ